MKREPIAIVNALVTFVQALIPVLLALGILNVTPESSAAITTAVVAWGGLVGTLLGRNLVTPVTDPRDEQGQPLAQGTTAPPQQALQSLPGRAPAVVAAA